MTWQPGEPLKAETERFHLRSLTPADADETYVGWWNDPEVQAGFNQLPRNWTVARAAQHIATFNNRDKFHLGIFCKATGKMIGFFTMMPNPQTKTAGANTCIGDKSYWRRGVATEIKTRMIDVMFEEFGMEKIGGAINGPNAASAAMNNKVGLKQEALCRKKIIGISGERVDVSLVGLLKEDWLANKRKKRNGAGAKEK